MRVYVRVRVRVQAIADYHVTISLVRRSTKLQEEVRQSCAFAELATLMQMLEWSMNNMNYSVVDLDKVQGSHVNPSACWTFQH